ncbi:lipopolysaccharide biosynthesis protein, partial [Streptomyces sp. DT18]
PEQAADNANAVARALVTAAEHNATDTRVSLVSFSRALAPSTPASPGALHTTGDGACAGGLLGALARLAPPRRPHTGPPCLH